METGEETRTNRSTEWKDDGEKSWQNESRSINMAMYYQILDSKSLVDMLLIDMFLKCLFWLESFLASIAREISSLMFSHVIIIVAFTSESFLTFLTPIREASSVELHVNWQATWTRVNLATFWTGMTPEISRVSFCILWHGRWAIRCTRAGLYGQGMW